MNSGIKRRLVDRTRYKINHFQIVQCQMIPYKNSETLLSPQIRYFVAYVMFELNLIQGP